MVLSGTIQNMTNIVTYSKGICSAYIACRESETCQAPLCVFSDTGSEHPDTYRFGKEIEARWNLSVVDASDGRHLYDWFRQHKMIPARQLAACSVALKIKPFEKWMNEFIAGGGSGRVAYGYDITESDRAERTEARWKWGDVKPWFPLIEWGISKEQCFGYFNERGITPPSQYKYQRNANCRACKNFRLPDWIALRYHDPEAFAEALSLEEVDGLKWMQDGPYLRDVPDVRPKVRKLAMATPAFNFDMGCDACAVG